MENNNKDKIKMLNSRVFRQLCTLLLQEIEKDLDMQCIDKDNEEIIRVEYLNRLLLNVERKLKTEMKLQEQRDKLGPRQTDLEILINDLATGKEKHWVNKLLNPDK